MAQHSIQTGYVHHTFRTHYPPPLVYLSTHLHTQPGWATAAEWASKPRKWAPSPSGQSDILVNQGCLLGAVCSFPALLLLEELVDSLLIVNSRSTVIKILLKRLRWSVCNMHFEHNAKKNVLCVTIREINWKSSVFSVAIVIFHKKNSPININKFMYKVIWYISIIVLDFFILYWQFVSLSNKRQFQTVSP